MREFIITLAIILPLLSFSQHTVAETNKETQVEEVTEDMYCVRYMRRNYKHKLRSSSKKEQLEECREIIQQMLYSKTYGFPIRGKQAIALRCWNIKLPAERTKKAFKAFFRSFRGALRSTFCPKSPYR